MAATGLGTGSVPVRQWVLNDSSTKLIHDVSFEKRNHLRGAAGFQSRSESWEMRCGRFDVCDFSFLLLVSRCSSLSPPNRAAVCLLRSEHVDPAPTETTPSQNRNFLISLNTVFLDTFLAAAGGRRHLSQLTCRRHDVSGSVMSAEWPGENTWEEPPGVKTPEDKKNRTTWIYWTQDRSSARDRWVRTCNNNRRDVTACTGLWVSPQIEKKTKKQELNREDLNSAEVWTAFCCRLNPC